MAAKRAVDAVRLAEVLDLKLGWKFRMYHTMIYLPQKQHPRWPLWIREGQLVSLRGL